MEPLTVAAAAGLVMKYLVPAIKDLGHEVLDSAEDSAGDEVVGFGKRLLHLLLDRQVQSGRVNPEFAVLESGIERRVRTLVENPAQDKAAIQLEGIIEELLTVNPALLSAITELVTRAPKAGPSQDDRSVNIGRDNLGTVVSGDRNTVMNSPPRRG
jgi:hypothetical protein